MADTGASIGRLMLAVLGGLADRGGDLIRTRTATGRSRARRSSNVSYITLAEIEVECELHHTSKNKNTY